MTREHGYKEFDATPVRSSMGPPNQSLGPTTSNSINRGLAAMPARERSITIEERAPDGDQPQRRHREAMARNTSPKGSKPRAEAHISQWDDAGGCDQETDEAARHRTKRLLSRPSSGFHRLGDKFAALQLWLTGLHHLFWRSVVAARRRAHQSRCGNALAGGCDRGKYRQW